MSIVKINTNVPVSDIDEKLLELSVESLAKTFQKPKSVSILYHSITYKYVKL